MSRLTNYIIIGTTITLLFYFAGLISDNNLLRLMLNPESLTSTEFYTTLAAALVTSAAGITIGISTKNVELAAATLFVPYFASIMWNFFDVFKIIKATNPFIAIMLFGGLFILFSLTIFEYWRTGKA